MRDEGDDSPRVTLQWPGKQRWEQNRWLDDAPGAAVCRCVERHGGRVAAGPPDSPDSHNSNPLWPNRLYQGDNLAILRELRGSLAGKIDLVYIDPPFASGVDYASSPNEGAPVSRDAYRDKWIGGLAGYLDMLWPRLVLVRELLAPTGSLFVHVGWQVNAHVRLMLDEVFGPDRLADEIVWHYQTSSGAPSAALIKNHGTIFHYVKGSTWTFNQLREPWPEATLRKWQRDEDGRVYRVQNRFGKRYYIDPEGKRIDDVWEFTLASRSYERTLYPTQKPEALLDRIIRMASNPGDLVADFFCGSGTTLAAAQKLGRRWIGCDLGDLAIQTTRRRLLAIPGDVAFELLRGTALGDSWEEDSSRAGLRAGRAITQSGPAGTPTPPGVTGMFQVKIESAAAAAGGPAEAAGKLVDPEPRIAVKLERAAGGWIATLESLEYRRPDLLPARFRDRLAATASDWPEYLDEWAVDWDYDGTVLMPQWNAFRTRQSRALELASPPLALAPAQVRVRAVDIFGREIWWQATVDRAIVAADGHLGMDDLGSGAAAQEEPVNLAHEGQP